MFSPLTQMLLDTHGYALVTEDTVDDFAANNDVSVLFFAGDAERIADSNDVAVILPELMKVFGDRITPAVVARDGDSERSLQRRFRFTAFPTLVFLKGGRYLGAISRVQDWRDYLSEITEILGREPTEPPKFELPGNCRLPGAGTSAAAH